MLDNIVQNLGKSMIRGYGVRIFRVNIRCEVVRCYYSEFRISMLRDFVDRIMVISLQLDPLQV